MCDFITKYKNELNYDWYIKIRPEIKLLEPIDLSILDENAINARARVYKGPRKIKYGGSVGGPGPWSNEKFEYSLTNEVKEIIIDDMIYIFSNNIINKNAFNNKNEPDKWRNTLAWKDRSIRNIKQKEIEHLQDEWKHTAVWESRNIDFNIIGLNVLFQKVNAYSGNINC